jgi:hypothetical protein
LKTALNHFAVTGWNSESAASASSAFAATFFFELEETRGIVNVLSAALLPHMS